MRLDTEISRRKIDLGDQRSMVHSLSSVDFLKSEESNMISFDVCEKQNKFNVVIMQQHKDNQDVSSYEEIFKVKLETMELQELILVKSMFLLENIIDMKRLIQLQPNKSLFYKSFMELDHANLLQILSFDSLLVKQLLENFDESIHDVNYPLFYKMQTNLSKNNKESQRIITNPIEIALEAN